MRVREPRLSRHAGRYVHLPLCRLVPRELPITFRELLRRTPARKQLCDGRLCGGTLHYPQRS